MAQIGFSSRKLRIAGEITFAGKCRTSAWMAARVVGAAAIFLNVGVTDPAQGRPQIGPSSSASVGISISVAPQYGLRASETEIRQLVEGAGFCMTTNGQPTDLPIYLVRHGDKEPAAGSKAGAKAAELNWCDHDSRTIQSADHGDRSGETLFLIVRPE